MIGGILAISYYAVPAMLLAPAPLAQRQWSVVHDRGRKTMPLLALTTSVLYLSLSSAYDRPAARGLPFLWNRSSVYLASAGLTIAMMPYAGLCMWDNIDGLHKAGPALEKCKDRGGLEALTVKGKTTKQLLDQWGTLNLGRVLFTGMGFILGMWASMMPYKKWSRW